MPVFVVPAPVAVLKACAGLALDSEARALCARGGDDGSMFAFRGGRFDRSR